jgi:uncharacterized protein (DUF885 family)
MKPCFLLLILLLFTLTLSVGCSPGKSATPVAQSMFLPYEELIALSPTLEANLAELQGLPIEEFFEESYRLLVARNPDLVIYLEGSYEKVKNGPYAKYGIRNDRFTDISDAYTRETQRLTLAILDLLHAYDRSALTYDQQVAYDIYEWYLDDCVRGFQFAYYTYPVNSASGWSQDLEFIATMDAFQIVTLEDAENYLARLSEVGTFTDQLIERLKLCEQVGVLPTEFMLQGSLAQVARAYSNDPRYELSVPEENVLYTLLEEKLEKAEGISDEQKAELLERARGEIERTVIPAWSRLQDYLTYLETIAPVETGAWNIPNGEAYLAYRLESAITIDISAEDLHKLGMKELEQIQKEMREIAHEELGYPRDISMYELNKRLKEESGSTDVMDLVNIHQSFLSGLESRKDKYFNIYPSREIVIKIAYPDKTYEDPDFEDSGPFVVRLGSRFGDVIERFEMDSWFYHEIMPGHVFSQFLFRELDLPAPTFQKAVLIPAYLEGWALYSEQLAWEMGLYEDNPRSNLGRLEFKALRAARLVAETGIHTKGWSLEEATSYFSAATGRPTPPSEVLRYIVDPGHGCSYYIGYLKIMELRQRAQKQLGSKFDIREFHDTILRYGQMPLPVMERVVDDWIATKLEE